MRHVGGFREAMKAIDQAKADLKSAVSLLSSVVDSDDCEVESSVKLRYTKLRNELAIISLDAEES